MATELSLDTLAEMKKADFVKAFKNKAIWKKAKAVIVLVDYKLDGKKMTVAVPYRKVAEMKKEMKRLKKEKIHLLKKSGGGLISFDKDDAGDRVAKIDLQQGGLKGEILEQKGEKLFSLLKMGVRAIADAAAELVEDIVDAIVPEENAPSSEDLVEAIKEKMKEIAADFKQEVKGNIVPAIKQNQATEEHLQQTQLLFDKIDYFESMVEDLEDDLRQKMEGSIQKILTLSPTLEKIKSKLVDTLGLEEEEEELNEEEIKAGMNLLEDYDPADDLSEDQLALEEEEAQPVNETDLEIEQLLNTAQQEVDHTEGQEAQLQAKIDEMAAIEVPAGEELINTLV